MRPAAIFDVDGTLCDVRSVRHHVMRRPKRFDRFHAEAVACPPHLWVVDLARQATLDGLDVLVVTSRKERWLYPTLWWLWEHSVPFEHLFMRPDDDDRKDFDVKRDILAMVRGLGWDVHFAVDDNPAVMALWRAHGIPVIEVPGWETHPIAAPAGATPSDRSPRGRDPIRSQAPRGRDPIRSQGIHPIVDIQSTRK